VYDLPEITFVKKYKDECPRNKVYCALLKSFQTVHSTCINIKMILFIEQDGNHWYYNLYVA